MKILVLAENYSTPDGVSSMQYIHTRNKWYIKEGLDVSVISFRAKEDYLLDGVKVYTKESYEEKLTSVNFDILLLHAPNLKNHMMFLNKHSNNFNNIIFYYHGHEVLKSSEVYPKPYKYTKKQNPIKNVLKGMYDNFKLYAWRKKLTQISGKSQFIFVSKWMYDMFIRFVKIDPKIIEDRTHIIYNCIGKDFEDVSYNQELEKEYDFITIRSNLDGSKYGIDIVTNLAKNNPKYKFSVIGKGEFFKHFEKPDNLDWLDTNLTHEEVLTNLNRSKYALLPTRTDAQGVMACEIATFGMPLITSDIDVCREVFEGFENVTFIDNDDKNIDLDAIIKDIDSKKEIPKNKKYFAENTVLKEIELFRKVNK